MGGDQTSDISVREEAREAFMKPSRSACKRATPAEALRSAVTAFDFGTSPLSQGSAGEEMKSLSEQSQLFFRLWFGGGWIAGWWSSAGRVVVRSWFGDGSVVVRRWFGGPAVVRWWFGGGLVVFRQWSFNRRHCCSYHP